MVADDDPSNLFNITLGVTDSILLILVLIVINAFFAMAEIALVSVRRTKVKQFVEKGVSGSTELMKLIEDPVRYLATIQIGITLVGFFASATGAVTLAEPLARTMSNTGIPFIDNNAGTIAVILVTALIGYISLVVGEISPKGLGLHYAERIALYSAKPLLYLSYIAYPLIKLITWSSNVLVKPLGVNASFAPPVITEEELKILVEAGEEEGVLEEEEKEMIHSIFEFTDTVVRKVMVPRIDIKAVEVNATIDELLDVITTAGHSRVPVYEETIDNIVGIIHAKDLLRILYENRRDVPLREIMRPPYVIPENKMVNELLAEFKRHKIQMAIVVDEYGGTAGLVTLEDLIEEIVGDIMDEYDVEEPQLVTIDSDTAIVDARMPIDEINELLSLELPEEEFDTIGGFVFGILGHEAHVGDSVQGDNADLIVEQMDGHRIQKIRIVKKERESDEDENAKDNSESSKA